MAGCQTAAVPLPAYLASLRVFVPLASLPQGERRRWERYVAAGRAPDRSLLLAGEHAAGLAGLVRPSLDVDAEHALVEVIDGITYICPARTQLRVWQAAGAFREGLPDLLADTFVPRGLAEEAADQLAGWREVSPQLRPHVRTAPWSVPLAWFLLFEEAERHQGPGTLRYAAPVAAALRRAEQALGVLRETLPQAPTTPMLEELAGWLAGFGGRARVELDYGPLAALLGDELAADTSVADLAEGLAALARGDGAGAAAAYERVAGRWRPLQARETAS